ncbi:3-deoxy-D-manno-octulosonic-acid transferase [Striga asiatica]|uniref:3-deoxy-D-manno-octulosonic-acid transferase n=1 Tax=Striga asiatica TaxID=4170 RepID=A0A5A7R0B7_STRAF|nr:3-deoxy-D-manno-octulosonic-acid transferase [Striga asiatica]
MSERTVEPLGFLFPNLTSKPNEPKAGSYVSVRFRLVPTLPIYSLTVWYRRDSRGKYTNAKPFVKTPKRTPVQVNSGRNERLTESEGMQGRGKGSKVSQLHGSWGMIYGLTTNSYLRT